MRLQMIYLSMTSVARLRRPVYLAPFPATSSHTRKPLTNNIFAHVVHPSPSQGHHIDSIEQLIMTRKALPRRQSSQVILLILPLAAKGQQTMRLGRQNVEQPWHKKRESGRG